MMTTLQNAIAFSVNHWLEAHPAVFRLLQILLWGTSHPIIAIVVLIFVLAIAWNLIKAISHLLEIAARGIVQAPFKFIQFLWGISIKSLGSVGGLTVQQFVGGKNVELLALPPAIPESSEPDKQQRLVEISLRLEVIQKEQNELLQEAAAILASDKVERVI